MQRQRPRHPRPRRPALAAALLLAVAGCSQAADDQVPRPDSGPVPVGSPGPAEASATADADPRTATVLAVADTALAAVGRGRVFAVGAEETGGWGATVVTRDGTEHDVVVSEDGRSVAAGPESDRDDDREDLRELARLYRAPVDHAAALRTAVRTAAAGDLSEVSLEDDHGRAVWEVTFGEGTASGVTVVVDATTGAGLGSEPAD